MVPLEGTRLFLSFSSLNEVPIIRSHMILQENHRGILFTMTSATINAHFLFYGFNLAFKYSSYFKSLG